MIVLGKFLWSGCYFCGALEFWHDKVGGGGNNEAEGTASMREGSQRLQLGSQKLVYLEWRDEYRNE